MRTLPSKDFAELEHLRKPVHLAIGMFDGLHLGHQSVIESAVRSAHLDDGLSAVLTFDPHPSNVFRPESPVPQIYPFAVKQEVLRLLKIDLCLVQEFDHFFARRSASEFFEYIQASLPTLVSISVGDNFRFGRERKGDIRALIEMGKRRGISVFSCERLQIDGQPISSTRIREALSLQPIETINRWMGRPYLVAGAVTTGRQLGRTIGFPTLNIPHTQSITPIHGVYLVRAGELGSDPHGFLSGVANLGLRPTVGRDDDALLEVHLLDGNCPWGPGDFLAVELHRLLRRETRFASIDELKAAIARDVLTARRHRSEG